MLHDLVALIEELRTQVSDPEPSGDGVANEWPLLINADFSVISVGQCERTKLMKSVLWIIQALLAFLFLLAGGTNGMLATLHLALVVKESMHS